MGYQTTKPEVIGSPTPNNFAEHPAAVPAVPVPSEFAWKEQMSGLANLKASVPFDSLRGGDSISKRDKQTKKKVGILNVIDDIMILYYDYLYNHF